ncbi:ribosomal RNA large subunit methyltransferase F-like protein, partial [Phlebopus sp. FC_14]
MHPRNIYTRPPDFVQLARRYPPLREQYVSKSRSRESDALTLGNAIQRRLTEALLYLDFHITLTLPDDRLCPPIIRCSRLNYVLWIQDLVRATIPNSEIVRGIDIGTGASAIYPLLACRLEPTWQFIATGFLSLGTAERERNGLSDRVLIVQVPSNDPILHLIEGHPSTTYNFTMCNPPFYSSAEEVASLQKQKNMGPTLY